MHDVPHDVDNAELEPMPIPEIIIIIAPIARNPDLKAGVLLFSQNPFFAIYTPKPILAIQPFLLVLCSCSFTCQHMLL